MGTLKVCNLGQASYSDALTIQHNLAERIKTGEDKNAYLLTVEHDPPVITLGRRGSAKNIVASESTLAAKGIEVCCTDRGGDVTYHGPGQLVAYPVLKLPHQSKSVTRYVQKLEQTIIDLLSRYDIPAIHRPGLTGVWVAGRKIAAIGVRVSRQVAFHGFAINVENDLSGFETIVPCGIEGCRVTSIKTETDSNVSITQIREQLIESFCHVFSFEPELITAGDL